MLQQATKHCSVRCHAVTHMLTMLLVASTLVRVHLRVVASKPQSPCAPPQESELLTEYLWQGVS